MLDAFRIGLRGFGGDAQGEQHIPHQPVTRADPRRKLLPLLGQENAAIGAARCQPFALQPRDRLDGGRVRDAEAAGRELDENDLSFRRMSRRAPEDPLPQPAPVDPAATTHDIRAEGFQQLPQTDSLVASGSAHG